MEDDLVYIPRVGFRSAHALGTNEKHVVTRGGATFTAEISPIRDACGLTITIFGVNVKPPTHESYQRGLFAPYPEFGTVGIHDDTGRDISAPIPRWTSGAWIRRTNDGEVILGYGTVIAPIAPDVRHVSIDVISAAGEWRVDVPVRPAALDGVPGITIDARDTRQGITIRARTIGRSSDLTAVELEVCFDPPDPADGPARRSLRGIGCSVGGGRLCGDRLFLRDEDDNVYFEAGFGAIDPGGVSCREVATFPPLPDRVRTVVLESEFMWSTTGPRSVSGSRCPVRRTSRWPDTRDA